MTHEPGIVGLIAVPRVFGREGYLMSQGRRIGWSLIVPIVCLASVLSAAESRMDHASAFAATPWRSIGSLWIAPDGATLYAGGAKSGTLIALDPTTRSVAWEIQIGRAIVSLDGTPDGQTLVACDSAANELLILNLGPAGCTVRARVAVATTPTHVTLDATGTYCYVSSRWSRQITEIDLRSHAVVSTVDLNFSPHRSRFLPESQTLAVADAFGGRLALVDVHSHGVIRDIQIPGHNIRGMAISPDRTQLLITHGIITESAATTRDNVFWGIVMTSNMRVIPISALADRDKNPVREAHTHFFGDPGNAAGDPDALAVLDDGTTVICLAGVGEVALGRYSPYAFRRIQVGARPSAIALSPDQKLAYIANAHSDTVSVVDIGQRAVQDTIRLGPEPGYTLADEGERLFYDSRLSLDGWLSCHSCHSDGHTTGYKSDTFGDGSYGAPKVILSLLGTGATEPWAWNGSKRMLEDQVRESMRTTMHRKVQPSEHDVIALTAYLRTLEPPPATAWQTRDSGSIQRGERIFQSRGCATCHAPPTFSNSHTYDVGLDDGDGGNRQFNPPSLRGVAHFGPYFHDGRAKSLDEVLQKFQHRLRTALSDDERADLVAYLKSL